MQCGSAAVRSGTAQRPLNRRAAPPRWHTTLSYIVPFRTISYGIIIEFEAPLGRVTADAKFLVRGLQGDTLIAEDIADLKEAWQRPLRW